MPRVLRDGKVGRKQEEPSSGPFKPEQRRPLLANTEPAVSESPPQLLAAEEGTLAPEAAPSAPPLGPSERGPDAPAPEAPEAPEAPQPEVPDADGKGAEAPSSDGVSADATATEEDDGTWKVNVAVSDSGQVELAGHDGERVPLVPLIGEDGEQVVGDDGKALYVLPEPEEEVFEVGDRVELHSMERTELVQLNGQKGTIIVVKPHGVHVRVDGRGKWLVLPPFLRKLEGPVLDLRTKSVHAVGTAWNNWKDRQVMEYDPQQLRHTFQVEIGKRGQESFQIEIDGDEKLRLHPDKADASPHLIHNLCGPDDQGKDRNWTIGKHQSESQSEGILYEVRLLLKEDGSAKQVEWQKVLGNEKPPTYPSISICCSYHDWKAKEMAWNPERRFFHDRVTIGREGEEGFQIWVAEDSTRCLHPDVNDACAYVRHELCGPDAKGHSKNWTIGKHPKEGNCLGFTFDVRLWVKDDGDPKHVDWVRVREPVRLPKHELVWIAGTWNKWKTPLRMTWDKARSCYYYKVAIGHERYESFQLVLDGEWKLCLHPDKEDANMHNDWNLCGPDAENHGKNWSIGRNPKEQVKKGEVYEVRLHLTEQGRARTVDWERVPSPAAATVATAAIAGAPANGTASPTNGKASGKAPLNGHTHGMGVSPTNGRAEKV